MTILRRLFLFFYRIEQRLLGRFGVGRLPFVKKIKQMIFPRLFPDRVSFYGLTLRLDPVYGHADNYKPLVAECLSRELRKGQVAIDIGANVGYFTCYMAKLVGLEGHVFAFEPEPRNLSLLSENIAANNLKNVTLVPKAVSDTSGTFSIISRGAHSTFGFDFFGDTRDFVSVEAIRLDDVPEVRGKNIALIKIDVVGADPKVFRGMKTLLMANKSVRLLLAFCPAYFEKAKESSREYLDAISGAGFSIYDVTRGTPVRVMPVHFDAFIVKYSRPGGIAQGELFCVRE